MLAMWNERDMEKVRGRIDDVFSDDVVSIDPANSIEGCDAFEKMVRAFRANFPDAVCSHSSGIDSHHGLHRYRWEIHSGTELLISEFDVTTVDAAGKISRIEGFFGPIPER